MTKQLRKKARKKENVIVLKRMEWKTADKSTTKEREKGGNKR